MMDRNSKLFQINFLRVVLIKIIIINIFFDIEFIIVNITYVIYLE